MGEGAESRDVWHIESLRIATGQGLDSRSRDLEQRQSAESHSRQMAQPAAERFSFSMSRRAALTSSFKMEISGLVRAPLPAGGTSILLITSEC